MGEAVWGGTVAGEEVMFRRFRSLKANPTSGTAASWFGFFFGINYCALRAANDDACAAGGGFYRDVMRVVEDFAEETHPFLGFFVEGVGIHVARIAAGIGAVPDDESLLAMMIKFGFGDFAEAFGCLSSLENFVGRLGLGGWFDFFSGESDG